MTMPLTEPRNRFVLVTDSSTLNGVDFIELKTVDATTLYVHFLNKVALKGVPTTATISGGDRIRDISLATVNDATDWSLDDDGRPILALPANRPGDFSTYTVTLANATLDVMYTSTTFSFKALCPAEFDCEAESECCAPDDPPLPAIDYLAKDFQSFKLALTDFSAQRYPSWQERSEADFGVMFMEALCAMGDELSYLQDRVAAEAALPTATQRRSLVSMARLVDYEPTPALSASTTVQCNVVGNTVPAGALISATTPDGTVVPFEIGTGLVDKTQYAVSPDWNDGKIPPYWFDDSQQCLPCGSTSMWLEGIGFGFETQIATAQGMSLLIQTDLPGESIREIVQLTSAIESEDKIFPINAPGTAVTMITWATPTARDHDLTNTRLAGNLLPATQGRRFTEAFAIGTPPPSASSLPSAIARYGPNGTAGQPNWIFRYPLSRSSSALGRLTWLPDATPTDSLIDPDLSVPLPEIVVTPRSAEPVQLQFSTSLLDATGEEAAFTVDPAAWRVVAMTDLGQPSQWEYDGDQGDTIRFGDSNFGLQPSDGDVYDVQYRIGLGAAGNVAPGAIQNVDPSATAYIAAVRNPFLVANGADAETSQHVQRMAPQAFRAEQFRAVRPEDYEASAETLPWVRKAGTSFRWTGSWLTVFTTADPKGNATVTEPEQIDLIDLLNRRRLAGYESYAPPPTLVAIDLQITVCVETGWLGSDVEKGVLSRLMDAKLPDGTEGFFYADSFTFGTPLYRSRLEAAIQQVAGVNGVLDVQYRRRGATEFFQELPEVLTLGSDEILRIENDPSYPERGTIRVFPEGGR
jgi:Baseplate J-like protein